MTKHEDNKPISGCMLLYAAICQLNDLNEPPSDFETEPKSPNSCSLSLLKILENQPNPDSESSPSSEKNHNGAFSSSSQDIHIDLNEPPLSDSEREEPQQSPDRCSSTLLGHHDIPENPPNPNPQTSSSSGKRPLERKRRSSGGFKKAKKCRPEQPEAVLEVSESSPPKWLDQVMKEEAKDVKLIFEKTLSVSDVNPEQSRYLIPFKKLKRNDFLTQVESSFIEQEEDNNNEDDKKPGVGAILVNERSEKWGLLLKRWKMKKKKNSENGTLNYALNCGWNDIVKGNGLKAKDKISLWSFRSREILCFALITHPPTMTQSSSSAIS